MKTLKLLSIILFLFISAVNSHPLLAGASNRKAICEDENITESSLRNHQVPKDILCLPDEILVNIFNKIPLNTLIMQ